MADVPADAWKWGVDRASGPAREPGPINLQRHALVPAYAGIATLFGLPLCLNPDDLRAGRVDVAVVGAPVDMSSGHRGAAYGPRAIRADERILPHTPQMAGSSTSMSRERNRYSGPSRASSMASSSTASNPLRARHRHPGAARPDQPRTAACHPPDLPRDAGRGHGRRGGRAHLDPGYTTTMNARRAIFEALTGIAMRRMGLPGPAYLDPAVSGPPPGRGPSGATPGA